MVEAVSKPQRQYYLAQHRFSGVLARADPSPMNMPDPAIITVTVRPVWASWFVRWGHLPLAGGYRIEG